MLRFSPRAAGFLLLACGTILAPITASAASHSGYPAPPPYGGYENAAPAPRAYYPSVVPDDFSSSSVCVGGYRWITRKIGRDHGPADYAIPVRCH